MRTEQEIKEQMKYEEEQMNFWFENANYTEYNRSYGAVQAFKFVLEDSVPKRTIFDLTEEELKQLADILWLKYDDDCTVYEHILYFETLQKFAERLQQILSKSKNTDNLDHRIY